MVLVLVFLLLLLLLLFPWPLTQVVQVLSGDALKWKWFTENIPTFVSKGKVCSNSTSPDSVCALYLVYCIDPYVCVVCLFVWCLLLFVVVVAAVVVFLLFLLLLLFLFLSMVLILTLLLHYNVATLYFRFLGMLCAFLSGRMHARYL